MKRRFLRACLTLGLLITQVIQPLPAVARPVDQDDQPSNPDLLTLYSLQLSGADGYIRVPYSTELNNLSALTIEAWVWRVETNRNETVVGNNWQDSYWLGFSPNGKLRFIPNGGGWIDSNATVAAGSWTHIAVTSNGFTHNLFINGKLDKTSSASPGAILGNANQPLGIGFDTQDTFDPNNFSGSIDEVRIWNKLRSPAEIETDLWTVHTAPLPSGLVAYWRLDGNAEDETGDHDGAFQGGLGAGGYGNDGAIPHDIRIPLLNVSPTLDGRCSTSEYNSAPVVSVDGVQVSLLHTTSDLWACFNFYTSSGFESARMYLDLNHDRLDPVQAEDVRLTVNQDDSLEAHAGDGQGGFSATQAYDGLWGGEYNVTSGEFPIYTAEFRLGEAIFGGWGQVVGLALGTDTGGRGGLNLWPALAVSTLPSTWSSATLGGISPPRTFNGQVVYQPKNASYDPTPVAGARLNLIGYDLGGSEALAATLVTGPSGEFSLTSEDDYTRHRLELSEIPKGYFYGIANAPTPAVVLDERSLDYGEAGPGTYAENVFTLKDLAPSNLAAPYGPVYLIVAPLDVIEAGALDAFRQFKALQGYAVVLRSVEEADTDYPGQTRLERIRAMEQEYLQTYGDRFQFVLLVGTDSVIPFARLTIGATGAAGTVCPDTDPVNFKYSEWMYVDLESNFDSNGNGCYADGIRTKPEKRVAGYTPDSGITFKVNVSVGRLPFTQPETIRTVLANSIGFEKQSEPYKLRALMGMSLLAVKGYFDGEPCSDWSTHCVGPSDNSQANYDMALLSEEMKSDFLNVNLFDTTLLYENEEEIAGGTGVHSPVTLSRQALLDELDAHRFGVVNLTGHGSSGAIYRTFWDTDKNSNGVADVSDDSSTELSEVQQLSTNDLSGLDKDNNRGAIFLLVSCNTAHPSNTSNLAASLLSYGQGVASIGGLNIITVGNWLNENSGLAISDNYFIMKRLLSRSYRLGESFWWTLSERIHKGDGGSGNIGEGIYGDPSLNFFGNPGGETSLAAWPMGRRDPSGTGYLSLPGPGHPKELWTYQAGAHGVDDLATAPLVGNNGEVIVGSSQWIDVLYQGQLYQRLPLDSSIFGTPALAADGTIYALDNQARLYAFPHTQLTLNGITYTLNQRYRRWVTDLGDNPSASPIVGPDGFIIAGIGGPNGSNPVLWEVRPDGAKFSSFAMDGNPRYFAATSADRSMFTTASDFNKGYLYHFTQFCDFFVYPEVCSHDSIESLETDEPLNTPPLLGYGSVYAGDVEGMLYQVDPDTLAVQHTYTADSAIKVGPTVGPGGSILFVTGQGTLYSLTKDLGLRWKRALGSTGIQGMPASANDAIYLVFDGYLRAYNPSSGASLWKCSLGANGSGSASVGYGREVYVQTTDGTVKAFGEAWPAPLLRLTAMAALNGTRPLVQVDIIQSLPPISDTLLTDGLAPQANVTGVLLQRSQDGGPWEDRLLLPAVTEVFTDTDVIAGSSYAYRAQNLSSEGSSDFAATLEEVQTYPELPGAPVLAEVTAESAAALHLSWSAGPGGPLDSFRIERSASQAGPFSIVGTVTGDETGVLDGGLAPGQTYYYRLVGLNATGEGPASNVLAGTTRTQTLPAPQNFQAAQSNPGQVNLTWQAGPAGATAVIEVKPFGSTDYLFLASAPAIDDSFSFNSGEVNAYNFRLKFVQGEVESPYAYVAGSQVIADPTYLYLPFTHR